MKFLKAISFFVITFCFVGAAAVFAGDIVVENADTVWNPDLITVSPDVIDSTDAPVQSLSDAYVSGADTVWSIGLNVASSDVTDSTDAPSQQLSGVFVSQADTVWKVKLENWQSSPLPPPPAKWSFAIITDLHIGRGYPDYDGLTYDDSGFGEEYYLTERLRKVVDWVNNNKNNIDCGGEKCPIQFLAVLGDITNNAEKSQFLKAKEILDKLNDPNSDGNTSDGIPYVPVFGNHDVWPYTDIGEAASSLGEIYFDNIFWNENATNTKLLKERLNFQRDGVNTKYKNFAFNYKDMNFIGLDFDRRVRDPRADLSSETENWLNDRLNEYGIESTIILSHHPFYVSSINGFTEDQINRIKEIIEDNNVLTNFAGHIHGFYPLEVLGFKIPEYDYLIDANEEEYTSINNTSIVTTESLMVGSNETDEYLKEHDKGIIRIVKVSENNGINYQTNEGKYNPDTGEGKEFIALNPYISFTFTQPTEIIPCVFFKAHAFTKREVSYRWDLGDGTTGARLIETRCYSNPGVYNVTLTVADVKTGKEEFITQKVEVKEGIIPKVIKVADEVAGKIELISTKLGEDLTKIGQVFKDAVLIKVKHSEAKPTGLVNIHFEEAVTDIDLTKMITDTDLEEKKSILYMPQWPETVEKDKIIFIPK